MSPLESYLRQIALVGSVGVAETSHYPAIKTLLDAAGEELKPQIVAVAHPADIGFGIPDLGLFTRGQLPKVGQAGLDFEDPKKNRPERGVVEVKGADTDLAQTVASEQVRKYLLGYKQVLVTNLRAFALVQLEDGKAVEIERYEIAPNAQAFRAALEDPVGVAKRQGGLIAEFLKRTLLAQTEIDSPAELAFFMASYAREARLKLDLLGSDFMALTHLRDELAKVLDVSFEGEQGEAFFRSELIQTLFYGVFSAWVLWHRERPERDENFLWRASFEYLKIPIIRGLFLGAMAGGTPEQTGLREALDNAQRVLARVDRPQFFASFLQAEAVQHFYEPFLAQFDPLTRDRLGVWYTPPEIVKYQVARVDSLLKTEFDMPDGLADPRVRVLDPCCGTGAYLVECLRLIADRLIARDGKLAAADIRKAAMERLFGFELLPAPYVISHLQVAALLAEKGAPLGEGDRAAIYFTNALAGWERSPEERARLGDRDLMGLYRETALADHVRHNEEVLVILGNPPYNGYAGLKAHPEEYLQVTAVAYAPIGDNRHGQGLNDLYVRFFAMADRKITQHGRGIVSFISNYSWLDGLSFATMRERILNRFDRIWIDNLHGDRIIGEYNPDGVTSETVFAVRGQVPALRLELQSAPLFAPVGQHRTTRRSCIVISTMREPIREGKRSWHPRVPRSLMTSTSPWNLFLLSAIP